MYCIAASASNDVLGPERPGSLSQPSAESASSSRVKHPHVGLDGLLGRRNIGELANGVRRRAGWPDRVRYRSVAYRPCRAAEGRCSVSGRLLAGRGTSYPVRCSLYQPAAPFRLSARWSKNSAAHLNLASPQPNLPRAAHATTPCQS